MHHDNGFFHVFLLGGFAIGLLLIAKCLVQIVFRKRSLPWWLEAISGLGALALAVILSIDAFFFGLSSEHPTFMASGLLTIGLSCILLWTHLRISSLQIACAGLLRQPVAWLAITLTCGASCWSAHRYYEGTLRLEMERLKYFAGAGQLEEIQGRVAVTDRGREVQVFRFIPDRAAGHVADASSAESFDSFSGLWGNSPNESNCHGWVFTGGKYLLWDDGVEMILEDNGYQAVEKPQAGDLVIYRSSEGHPVHTGVVYSVGWDGTVMIKSKWALGGRFIHLPEDQPYGNNYTFYRSQRSGHLITIRTTQNPSAAQASSPTGSDEQLHQNRLLLQRS